MYPVSLEFQNKIKENNRTFKTEMEIQHSTGVLNLDDKDLALGTLIYKESSQSGEEFTIGSTVASEISFTILNKPEYENISFEGATVIPDIYLLLDEVTDRWESVPLGRFNIDRPLKQRNTIELKAIDNMVELDKPYSLSSLSYPANLYQIYVNICNIADIQVGTVSFPNMNYVVQERPDNDLTFRDILGYVAELAGCFAKINRAGALEIKWYTPTGLALGPGNRFNFKASDYTVQIKGVMATVNNNTYLAGTNDYAIDLTDNPLLQGGYETVLPVIFNHIKDTVFTTFESSWQGNPAIQAGDIITQEDRDGNIFNTLVTSSTYKYRGSSTLSAKGLPESAKGYKGSTNKRITNIVRKQIKPIGDQLTTLEQAQIEATELLANMLGGYIVKDEENGILYIADNPNIDLAMKVWKYGINGFGYSSTGKDGPFTTSVTADGSIVAMLVAANIITADMVQTGLLSSEDGSTWINLDDGTFNLKDKVKFVNDKLSIVINESELEDTIDSLEFDNQGFKTRIQSIEANMNFEFIQDTAPPNPEIGNVWFSTSSEVFIVNNLLMSVDDMLETVEYYGNSLNKSYRWDGSIWQWIEDGAITELRQSVSEVVQTNQEISSKVTSTELDVNNLTTRVSSAEQKITAEAITSTVESNTTTLAKKTEIPDVTNLASKSEVEQTADNVRLEFTTLKTKSGGDETIESGVTKIDKNGIKVTHYGTTQYSELKADGFKRTWENGESAYLNDIWMETFYFSGVAGNNIPSDVKVVLPSRFKNRGASVKILLTISEMRLIIGSWSGRDIVSVTTDIDTTLRVSSSNFTLNNPELYIRSYFTQRYQNGNGTNYRDYGLLGFTIAIIGE